MITRFYFVFVVRYLPIWQDLSWDSWSPNHIFHPYGILLLTQEKGMEFNTKRICTWRPLVWKSETKRLRDKQQEANQGFMTHHKKSEILMFNNFLGTNLPTLHLTACDVKGNVHVQAQVTNQTSFRLQRWTIVTSCMRC